jgi:hypothetical protein
VPCSKRADFAIASRDDRQSLFEGSASDRHSRGCRRFDLSRFVLNNPETFQILTWHDHGWYTLKPNLDDAPYGWGKTFYPVSTDRNGFRIERSDIAERPAEFVFLGDSFTFGINGPWNETFVGMFEKKSGRPTINTGVGSYSPAAYLHQYKLAATAGVLARPHNVVVGLDVSDVFDEAALRDDGPDHPRKSAAAEALSRASERSGLQKFLSAHFRATRAIYRLIRYGPEPGEEIEAAPPAVVFDRIRSAFTWKDWKSIERGVPDDGDPNSQFGYGAGGVARGLEKVRATMLALSKLVKANDGELWILIYPWPAQLKHGMPVFDWRKFAAALCETIACRGVIDTFPAFHAIASTDPDWYRKLYVFGDSHFNKFGNEIVADQLLLSLIGPGGPEVEPAVDVNGQAGAVVLP